MTGGDTMPDCPTCSCVLEPDGSHDGELWCWRCRKVFVVIDGLLVALEMP